LRNINTHGQQRLGAILTSVQYFNRLSNKLAVSKYTSLLSYNNLAEENKGDTFLLKRVYFKRGSEVDSKVALINCTQDINTCCWVESQVCVRPIFRGSGKVTRPGGARLSIGLTQGLLLKGEDTEAL
jgi:hypothetical protein